MPSRDSLENLIEGLGSAIVVAQQQLDARVDADLVALAEHREEVPPMLLEAILPSMTRVREVSAEARIEVSARRTTAVEVGLELAALPVTTFYEARFGRSEQTVATLRIVATAGPPFDRGAGGDE